jgi:hypothetical protein
VHWTTHTDDADHSIHPSVLWKKDMHAPNTHNQSINQHHSLNQPIKKNRHARAKQSQSIHPLIQHQSTDQSIHQSKQERHARSLNENEKDMHAPNTYNQSINQHHWLNQPIKKNRHARAKPNNHNPSIHLSKQERHARSLNENEKEACTRQTLTITITIHPSIHPASIHWSINPSIKERHVHSIEKRHTLAKHLQSIRQWINISHSINHQSIHPSIHPSINQSKKDMRAEWKGKRSMHAPNTYTQSINWSTSLTQSDQPIKKNRHTRTKQSQPIHPSIHPASIHWSINPSVKASALTEWKRKSSSMHAPNTYHQSINQHQSLNHQPIKKNRNVRAKQSQSIHPASIYQSINQSINQRKK